MKRYIIILFLGVLCAQIQLDHSSNIHFGTIHRVSDYSFIKVPFRLANYSNRISYSNFELNSKVALEFVIKDPLKDSYFNPELREMYLSWYVPFGQLNFGNIIHSWGILSNNSPTDNLSPTNYYYIFSRGTERKIAQLSFTGDIYLGSHSLGFVFNTNHKGTKIPLNDSELPINLPLPENPTINKVDDFEYGAKYKYSGSLFDLELSYFNGYDKTMSSLGANTWIPSKGAESLASLEKYTYVDTVLAYRKTEVLGLGFSTFIDDLSLKTEVAYFFTDDLIRNAGENIQGVWTPLPDIYRPFPGGGEGAFIMCEEAFEDGFDECVPEYDASYHMGTRAEYMQYVLELEYPLFFDIQLSTQFIFHDLIYISTGIEGDGEIRVYEILGRDIDLLPEHNFIPGMGSPLTIFTLQEHPEWGGTVNLIKSRTVYLNLKKFLWDYTLETNLRTFFDVMNKGSFIEVEGIYDLNDSWKISSAINFITGNKNSGDSYPFNPMENFSHFRLEFIYFF